ncbi:two-component system response regulator YesN [Paenibacillus phyllosphaerae]|uniref:Two-component system response regulator YesN n=1 Tax=Paenibacillus phyllosphaerae TaxID=274593 RepID=A0A7W5B2J9_9BACL|nr:response regulator [Paenibacillus phyllosphaerae]MBB3112696.1 two-component system response regulator YesN [Paenibacillus phyllosphaerae]
MAPRWKVLIADDETIIREGIRGSVPWDRLGMEVVCEAEDGEEALELAVLHRVHILLVDLSMPIMNGLTLIQHIREQLPACKVVIITGHDEFAYAHEAIKLNVDDYILKPINPAALTDVLDRVVTQLNASIIEDERLHMASKQIEKNFTLLRERFCLEWIKGDLAREEIEEQLLFLRMPQEAPQLVGVLRWPEQSNGRSFYSERDRQLLLFAMENIVEECLDGLVCIHCRDQSGLIVLFVWGAPSEGQLERIQGSIAEYLKIQVLASYHKTEGEMLRIPELYAEARSAVHRESRLSPLVRRTKELIETRFHEPLLSLEGVASDLCVSTVYLSRIFKQETGTSFVSMLTHMRIKQAILLLSETDLAMHEIAHRIGYETQHYFSTAFKKAVGVSPNQYRKSR